MNFKRSERVSELLRHEISQLVMEITDPRLGFVTITSVEVSDDLMDAKIYYSVFGTPEEQQTSTWILRHSIPLFRRSLGRKLESLYKPPALHFVYDHTPARAQKILTLLSDIHREKTPEEREAEEQAEQIEIPPAPEETKPNEKYRKKRKETK